MLAVVSAIPPPPALPSFRCADCYYYYYCYHHYLHLQSNINSVAVTLTRCSPASNRRTVIRWEIPFDGPRTSAENRSLVRGRLRRSRQNGPAGQRTNIGGDGGNRSKPRLRRNERQLVKQSRPGSRLRNNYSFDAANLFSARVAGS